MSFLDDLRSRMLRFAVEVLRMTPGAFVGILICNIALIGAAVVLIWQVSLNRQAISYICDTNVVLDDLVVTAGNQIQKNFDDHTYDKLVKSGLLSKQNVEAARATLSKYRQAHVLLKNNGACR